MGVRVVEADSSSDSFDDDDSCSTCQAKAKTSYPKHTSTAGAKSSFTYANASKDLVGNCKEFRIENNSRNLRIIGNGNRVRILSNTGSLQIIGNNTRLKVQDNSAPIKYTGNDGRIYLGSESKNVAVDYIGCNGILKVVKSMDWQGSQCKTKKQQKNGTQGVGIPAGSPPTARCNSNLKASGTPGVEISNNLTIVNNIGGNIVIKNAINVNM
ncbi:uncharacterized protein LOC115633776 isoform X2 [Scaptodrosophila lebanonensis]|nr:uncharacterized protein LOC115633776 isoform X2 [Scaptodrosophila lebanonensis]